MAHGRPKSTGPEDRGPAPSDLLQMWISGRTSPPATDEEQAVETETAELDTAEPDAVELDAVEPDTAEPDTAAAPDTAEPDTAEPDTAAAPDTAEPDTAELDTAAAPDTAEPGTGEAVAAEPGAEAAEEEPDVSEAQAVELDAAQLEDSEAVELDVAPALEPAVADSTDDSQPDLTQTPVAPGAEQDSWWPSDVEAAAETEDVADEPSPWWPYEPDSVNDELDPGQPAQDVSANEPEPEVLQPESPDPAPVQSNLKLTAREAADRARGWASFGVAPTAEDVLDQIGTRGVWPDHTAARPPIVPPPRLRTEAGPTASVDAEAVEETQDRSGTVQSEPAAPPVVRARRELDMSSTAHWTLDDFEKYIRLQTGNEPAEWIGEPESDEAEQSGAGDPAEAVVDVPAEPVTEPAEELSAEAPSDRSAETISNADPATVKAAAGEYDEPSEQLPGPAAKDHPSRGVRGLLARLGLTREPEPVEEEPVPMFPAVVSPPAATAPPVATPEPQDAHSAAPAAPPIPTAAPEQTPANPELANETSWVAAEQEWTEADVEWVEPDTDAPAPAAEADEAEQPAEHDLAEPTYDPDETAYFDWTTADFEGPPPGAAEAATVHDEAAPTAETPLWFDAGSEHDDDPDQDHQEWYDDSGLKWTSDDGGYTWFSTDGQGWDAEIGEPIDVPVVSPAASVTSTPQISSDAPPETETVAERVEPEPTSEASADAHAPETDQPPWPQAPTELDEHDVWPTGSSSAADHDASSAYWSDPTETAAAEHPDAATPTALEQPPAGRTQGADADQELPQFVEYKPRGAYRPLLGALFVAAAILAVIAIFWAVSKGSQAATGIAAGVTGFALAFWWGLLSWTPTVVSVNGSTLEVARGAESERFDLRDPDLVIEQDADPTSRNWRTTITRANGTELVIPASAVEPVEFTSIVRHYRDQAGQSPRTDTRT